MNTPNSDRTVLVYYTIPFLGETCTTANYEESDGKWYDYRGDVINTDHYKISRWAELPSNDEEESSKTSEGLTDAMIDRAYNSYVCMDYDETERVLKEIYNNPNIKDGSLIDYAHEDFQILQKFEFVFTVEDFFDQLRS